MLQQLQETSTIFNWPDNFLKYKVIAWVSSSGFQNKLRNSMVVSGVYQIVSFTGKVQLQNKIWIDNLLCFLILSVWIGGVPPFSQSTKELLSAPSASPPREQILTHQHCRQAMRKRKKLGQVARSSNLSKQIMGKKCSSCTFPFWNVHKGKFASHNEIQREKRSVLP